MAEINLATGDYHIVASGVAITLGKKPISIWFEVDPVSYHLTFHFDDNDPGEPRIKMTGARPHGRVDYTVYNSKSASSPILTTSEAGGGLHVAIYTYDIGREKIFYYSVYKKAEHSVLD